MSKFLKLINFACMILGLANCAEPLPDMSQYSSRATRDGITLTISPSSAEIIAASSLQFSASGGREPYVYSLSGGDGSLDSTGLFTAPETIGNSTISVVDADGRYASATVTIKSPGSLTLACSPNPVVERTTAQLTAIGGTGTIEYRIFSGGGSLSGQTYTADAPGSVTFQARDANGVIATLTINVVTYVGTQPKVQIYKFTGGTSLGNPYLYGTLANPPPGSTAVGTAFLMFANPQPGGGALYACRTTIDLRENSYTTDSTCGGLGTAVGILLGYFSSTQMHDTQALFRSSDTFKFPAGSILSTNPGDISGSAAVLVGFIPHP